MQAWARGNMGGQFEHIGQYAKQQKISIEDALEKFGYERPAIPMSFEAIWDWFFELSEGRSHNGFGWNALSWQDMAAWSKLTGVRLAPWLARIFRAMDQEWLREMRNQERKNAKSGSN